MQPGGFGNSAVKVRGYTVSACAAVNAYGCIRDPETSEWLTDPPANVPGALGQNTTLCIVATDAPLTRVQATILARMATAGLSRCTWPAFTPYDGDIVFAVSTAEEQDEQPPGTLMMLGDAAARALAAAVCDGVRSATRAPGATP